MLGRGDFRVKILRAVHDSVYKGFINVGDVGEFVATIILLFAFDVAYGSGLPRAVKFSEFTEALLHEDDSDQVRDPMLANAKLKKIWTEGRVVFQHVVRIGKIIVQEMLKRAYKRGAAILPPIEAKGCDIIIPIHMPHTDEVTYFLVQVKIRKDDKLTPALRLKAQDSIKSAQKSTLPPCQACVGIFMSLRRSTDRHPSPHRELIEVVYPRDIDFNLRNVISRSWTKNFTPQTEEDKPQPQPQNHYDFRDGNRVVIAALGACPLTYRVLETLENSAKSESRQDFEHIILEMLLRCREDLPDSGRPSVRNMLPVG